MSLTTPFTQVSKLTSSESDLHGYFCKLVGAVDVIINIPRVSNGAFFLKVKLRRDSDIITPEVRLHKMLKDKIQTNKFFKVSGIKGNTVKVVTPSDVTLSSLRSMTYVSKDETPKELKPTSNEHYFNISDVRGFPLKKFKDTYGNECSIQESSNLYPHLWLGIDVDCVGGENTEYRTRMHLNKAQLTNLRDEINSFLDKGKLLP